MLAIFKKQVKVSEKIVGAKKSMSFNQNKNTKLFPRTLLEHDNSFFLNEKKVFIGIKIMQNDIHQLLSEHFFIAENQQ